MRYGLNIVLAFGFIFCAYFVAQRKIQRPLNINQLRLGMSSNDLESHFGTPSAQSRNQNTYILDDGSELTITLRDDVISSANVKFHKILKIQDPEMKQLSLVQMSADEYESNRPSWFYAGKPEEGLIYKITSEGVIESLTWVPPFSYGRNKPKQLQALLEDFQAKKTSNL